MPFEVPAEAFRNDTIYHQFGSDYLSNLLGCGFKNKKGRECRESNNVFRHYAVVLVLHGKAVQIDAEGGRTEVTPGCLIQRIPGKKQTLLIDPESDWLEFFICISKCMYDALVSMDLLDKRQNVLYPGLNRALYDECSGFHGSMKHTHPADINRLIPEALRIILLFHELHRGNGTSNRDREIIHKACSILSMPSAYKCSVPDMAKDMGIGYEKFRKLFKKQVGIPPGNYMMQKRMDHAKKCLVDRKKSIKEIARELGFADAYAFSKQFQSVVGVSPSEFRRDY